MFSRNNNTQENYKLEQKRNNKLIDYRFFENSPNGPAYTTHLQGNGLGITKLHPKDLTDNYIDVDSFLKGIGSCNFVEPQSFQYQPKKNTFLHMDQSTPVLLAPQYRFTPQRPGFT
jgi:hypothetical protein